jgi:TatD DNase family protein
MKAEFFDTHAHVTFQKFAGDLDEVLGRAREEGVVRIVSPGADLASSRRAVEVAAEREGLYAAVGVSPHDAKDAGDDDWEALRELAEHPKVVAWGEAGLDYHYEFSDRRVQREVLARQLGLAREANLPVIFHFREAGEEFFRLLEEEGLPRAGGVMHCFTGTLGEMKRSLDLGLHISFSGIATFRKTKGDFAALISGVPEDRILAETDSPYLAPEPHRGKRAEPSMVVEVVRRIAEVRGWELETAAGVTRRNGERLFRVGEPGQAPS